MAKDENNKKWYQYIGEENQSIEKLIKLWLNNINKFSNSIAHERAEYVLLLIESDIAWAVVSDCFGSCYLLELL